MKEKKQKLNNMAQQTAVKWFNQQLVDKQNGKDDSRSWDEILEQAEEMFKGQIVNAWDTRGSTIVPRYFLEENINGEQYYKQIYGND